jgi:hypothetical protein
VTKISPTMSQIIFSLTFFLSFWYLRKGFSQWATVYLFFYWTIKETLKNNPAAQSLLTLSNPLQEFRDLNPTQLEAAQVAIRKIIEENSSK